MYYWNKPMETIGREDLERIQLERLQRTVLRMYTNVPFYRERMQQQGVKPEDVQSLADLRLLPFIPPTICRCGRNAWQEVWAARV